MTPLEKYEEKEYVAVLDIDTKTVEECIKKVEQLIERLEYAVKLLREIRESALEF